MKLANKVLLVGSDGYIGSNCPMPAVEKVDIKSGLDFLEVEPRFYHTIIFLAAQLESSTAAAFYNQDLYTKLDDWLKQFPKTHVIYSSSAAVYGNGHGPQKENCYLAPINLYGHAKLNGEYHVREYAKHTVLRFGNVYGKMKGLEGHGVTELFQMGVKTIYGDGEQVRDFVPVSKVWQVIRLATKFPQYWQGVFNVSLSSPKSINEWYEEYGHGTPDHIDAREDEIYTSILDNSKMKERIRLCTR